jgi:hypothetical protein
VLRWATVVTELDGGVGEGLEAGDQHGRGRETRATSDSISTVRARVASSTRARPVSVNVNRTARRSLSSEVRETMSLRSSRSHILDTVDGLTDMAPARSTTRLPPVRAGRTRAR